MPRSASPLPRSDRGGGREAAAAHPERSVRPRRGRRDAGRGRRRAADRRRQVERLEREIDAMNADRSSRSPASSCRAARRPSPHSTSPAPSSAAPSAPPSRCTRPSRSTRSCSPISTGLSDHLFVAARFVAARRGRRRAVAARRDAHLTRPWAQSGATPFRSVPHHATEPTVALSAIAINCTLKRSGGEPSSTDKMIGVIAGELAQARRRAARDDPHRRSRHQARRHLRRGRRRRTGPISADDPRPRHPDLRHADLARPAVEPRQARRRAHGRLLQRNRRRRPDAELRQGRGDRHRRQRGRRAPCDGRACSRRSTTPAGPCLRRRPAIGSARRCTRPTSRTCPKCPTMCRAWPGSSLPMPLTSQIC